MLDTSKNSDSKQRRETNQNMTRSFHRKWGQAINACPHFAKSYGIVGAIFAEHIGQYRQPLPKIHLYLFISIERSIRDTDGTMVFIAFYERTLD